MLIRTKNISLVEFFENNHKKKIVYETQIPIDERKLYSRLWAEFQVAQKRNSL